MIRTDVPETALSKSLSGKVWKCLLCGQQMCHLALKGFVVVLLTVLKMVCVDEVQSWPDVMAVVS